MVSPPFRATRFTPCHNWTSFSNSFLSIFASRRSLIGSLNDFSTKDSIGRRGGCRDLSVYRAGPGLVFLVEEGDAQFIIATHSPLLLAYPGARILSFDDGVLLEAAYDELAHVTLTKSFLENPERYLRQI